MRAFFAVAALSAVALAAPKPAQKNVGTFNPPATLPFIHIDLAVEDSTIVPVLEGFTGQANNQGGNVTGALTGTVLKLGTELEVYPTAAQFTESSYDNIFTLKLTDNTVLHMGVTGNIHYDGNAASGEPVVLHGFGRIFFRTDNSKYAYLNYGNYITEFEAKYPSGKVAVDVFELQTKGKR